MIPDAYETLISISLIEEINLNLNEDINFANEIEDDDLEDVDEDDDDLDRIDSSLKHHHHKINGKFFWRWIYPSIDWDRRQFIERKLSTMKRINSIGQGGGE